MMATKASLRKKTGKKVARTAKGKPGEGGRVRPSKLMMSELHQVVLKHGWKGSPAVVRPLSGPTATINCPLGQCPVMVSVPGPGGTIINVPVCMPC
jgi:hypothetical protein